MIISSYSDLCNTDATLRPYQQKAKREIFGAWDEVDGVMFQMPTGTGKTRRDNGDRLTLLFRFRASDRWFPYGRRAIPSYRKNLRQRQVMLKVMPTLASIFGIFFGLFA